MLRIKVPVFLIFAACSLLNFIPALSQTQKKLKTIIVDAGHGGSDGGATGQYENSLRSKEKDITLAISLKLVAQLRKSLPDVNTIPTRTTDIFDDVTVKAKKANDAGGQLFICIHADSGPLKQGRRQIGTRMVTRYKVSYKGKGRKKKKISTPYEVEEPVYEYFKIPLTRTGTSVWIFAANKTSEKLKAIMNGGEDFEIEQGGADSVYNNFDFDTPEGRNIANIYMKRFQERSDRLATLVNEEVEITGRPALGVNQRQKGIWVLQATNMPAILIETGFINNPEDERYLNSEAGQQELAEAITKAVIRYKEQIENPQKLIQVNGTNNGNPAEKAVMPTKTETPVENRPVKEVKLLQVKSDKVKVEVYDDGEVDNDIISLFFNNKKLAGKTSLTAKPLSFDLILEKDKTNELVLYAENLGDIPPNTALMIITDGVGRYEVRLSADLKNNGVVRFELKNNN